MQILPMLAGVMRHCGQNTAPEKPVAKLSFTSTKPQVASITPIYGMLGQGLALFGGAAEGSAPQQQGGSHSQPMPRLWSSRQPGQMAPRPKERSLTD